MSYRYSSRSTQRLSTCHPDLVLLFDEALADPACPSDISIIEGFRGRDRQNEMKTQGKSQLGSRGYSCGPWRPRTSRAD